MIIPEESTCQNALPTWTKDITGLICTIIRSDNKVYGTYHYSGEGECTWFEFAREIFRLGKENGLITSDCTLNPCSSEEFPTPAKRPAYSLLSKERVKQQLRYPVRIWKESLSQYISSLKPIVLRARQWQELALEDFDSASYMFEGNRYSYVYFLCQQAVEKTLKTLIEFYTLPPKTHNLVKLAVLAEIPLTDKQELFLMKLFRNYTRMRYPELNRFTPKREETEKTLKETGDFLCLVKTKPMIAIL